MVYFSDARETSNLFGGYIEQVQQALAANRVHFGSPTDFLTFTETLETDSRLRNDLAVLARSFMSGENNVSLRTVLSIIAIASGGPDLATSNGDMSQPVSVLVDFLISVSGSTPSTSKDHESSRSTSSNLPPYQAEFHEVEPQPYLPPPPSLDHRPLPNQTPPNQMLHDYPLPDLTLPDQTLQDQTLETLQDQALPDPVNDTADLSPLETDPSLPNLDPLPHSGAGSSLVESLTRLELNSLQVKHYLDSIDQRISRIEPRLDNLPTHPLPATPPQLGHAPEARYSSVLTSEPLPNLPPDEPPPPAPVQTQAAKPPDTLPHREPPPRQAPLQAPSRNTRNKIAIPVTTAVAAALLVSLLYWGFGRHTSSITIQPTTAPTAENRMSTPQTPAPAAGVNTSNSPAATAPPTQSPVATAPTLSPGTDTRAPSHSTQIRRSISSPHSSAAATPPSTPPAGTRIELPKPSAASLAGPDDSTYPSTLMEPVNVSSGVMAANVLSAPQPSYPKLASLTRMQGAVVMQAIISKEGTIENVHVIKGHRLLRGAATNAVRSWRYRPYLINGHPVEVATTVSVDFKLPQ
jgi:TonB family protein